MCWFLKLPGPSPDVDFVLSICMQSNFPAKHAGKPGTNSKQLQGVAAPSLSDISGSNKSHLVPNSSTYKPTRDRQTGKRKDYDSMLISFILCDYVFDQHVKSIWCVVVLMYTWKWESISIIGLTSDKQPKKNKHQSQT